MRTKGGVDKLKVLGYGDNTADRYVNQNVQYPGGNCVNFSVYAKQLGAESAYLGYWGDDAEGKHARDSLIKKGVDVSRCAVQKGSATERCDVNIVDGNRVFLEEDARENLHDTITPEEAGEDYLKGFDLIHSCCYGEAEEALAQLKGHALITYDFADEEEFRKDDYLDRMCPDIDMALFSCEGMKEEEIKELAEKAHAKGAAYVLATMGMDGQLFYDGKEYYRGKAKAIEAIDTMGAGDSFFTAFVISLLRGGWKKETRPERENIEKALKEGAEFAAKTCLTDGAFGCGRPISEDQKMNRYDRKEYLDGMTKIIELREQIEAYADEIISHGLKNIVLSGVGGTYAIMLPIERFAKKHTKLPVFVESAAEIVLGGDISISERSLVVLYSDSGTTAETVALAKYCSERGIPTIGVSCTAGAELLDHLKYPILSEGCDQLSCDGDYMRLYMIIAAILNRTGDYPDYDDFLLNLEKMPGIMADMKETVEHRAKEDAERLKDEDYHMIVGGGNLWGPAYCFAMCYLEEMQWIRTRATTAPEFFHGVLELVEEDTSVMLFKPEDETRPLAERVERFAKKISKKVNVIDTADYELPGVDKKYRADLAPFIAEVYIGRFVAELELATGHSLDTRRYYRQFEY
jgi:fructoselysine-6-P-deglycase FrlB-like protein/sugar/nucleoside kinase (ribokinase family)